MKKMEFRVQGSAEEPYKVTFKKDGSNLSAYCTCPAGKNGQYCKHRFAILDGKTENIVSKNKEDVKKVTLFSRREAIALLGAAALSSLGTAALSSLGMACTSAQYTGTPAGILNPLVHSSASALARAIRIRQISSVEVVTAYLGQINRVNPKLNAVVQLARDAALKEAAEADRQLAAGVVKGPLHGVPMTIKDSLDTAGVISTGGTAGRRHYVPPKDATVVARLRNAGAILLGKTNTPEFTDGGETDNAVYGRTNNPYDVSRTPGGSSGGAGAIVSAAGSPFDIGSDTTGSVRGPAHFCGIAGLKPSVGRVPRTGHIIPFASGALDMWTQIGPLARWVEDLDLIIRVIAGPDWQDPTVGAVPLGDSRSVNLKTLRIAFHVDNGIITPTPETIQAVQRAARALDGEVLQIDDQRPPGIERTSKVSDPLFEGVYLEQVTRAMLEAGTSENDLSRGVKKDVEALRTLPRMSAADLDTALVDFDLFRSEMLSFMEHYDVILCPVNAFPAMPHGQQADDQHGPGWSYTWTYSATGWPAGVVRAGTSPEGMPIAGFRLWAAPGVMTWFWPSSRYSRTNSAAGNHRRNLPAGRIKHAFVKLNIRCSVSCLCWAAAYRQRR